MAKDWRNLSEITRIHWSKRGRLKISRRRIYLVTRIPCRLEFWFLSRRRHRCRGHQGRRNLLRFPWTIGRDDLLFRTDCSSEMADIGLISFLFRFIDLPPLPLCFVLCRCRPSLETIAVEDSGAPSLSLCGYLRAPRVRGRHRGQSQFCIGGRRSNRFFFLLFVFCFLVVA